MASPNATFTELVSTTFRKHGKAFVDNVSKNNALLAYLMRNNQMKKIDGGLSIVEPLDYNSNNTYQRYSGYDVLNVSASDVLSSAEFQWRQIAVNVVASGLEMRINKGDSRIIALVKSRIKNAVRTFKNNFSVDLYSDGTLPNQIGGLQSIIADSGVGVVGGIDASNFPFWKPVLQSAANPIQGGGAVTVSATTIEAGIMLPLYLQLTRGDDQPNLIVASNDWYSFFEASQASLKRYASDNNTKATAGFVSLKYKKADVIFDGGSGIPAAHMYFMNTDYLDVAVHEDANMTVLDEVKPYNQDAAVVPVLWMGNMVVSNRSLQGVAKA